MRKRVPADRPEWRRVRKRRFHMMQVAVPEFAGHVTLLQLDEVVEPLWVGLLGQQVCIVDTGYDWLQHFPAGAHYALTTMFDTQGRIVEWYIDICRGLGVDERGVPWYDDLYLDILIDSQWRVEVLDAGELEDALRQGAVTQAEYDMAWRETEALLDRIRRDAFPLPHLSAPHRAMLLERQTHPEVGSSA